VAKTIYMHATKESARRKMRDLLKKYKALHIKECDDVCWNILEEESWCEATHYDKYGIYLTITQHNVNP